MARSSLILLIFLSSALAACASHSASSGAGGPPNIVVLNGCRVDPARICDNIRGQPVDMSGTGLQADPRMLEQNAARTANVVVPVKKLNGDEIFEVECGINTLNQSVSWAQVTGPPVTDDDVKYLRARNFCSEP